MSSTQSSASTPPTVCGWDPQLPADAADCVPDIAVVAICTSLGGQDDDGYRYSVLNAEDGDLAVQINGIDAVLVPGENVVDSGAAVLTVTWDGRVAAGADGGTSCSTEGQPSDSSASTTTVSVLPSSSATAVTVTDSAGRTTVTTRDQVTTPLATTGGGPLLPMMLTGGLTLLVGGGALMLGRRRAGAHRAH